MRLPLTMVMVVLGSACTVSGIPDAAPKPDARVADARVSGADAMPGAPDAAARTADAAPGTPDAACAKTWYVDCDGDGFAPAGAATMSACSQPSPAACGGGWVTTAPTSPSTIDCNDARADSHPGGTEICDGFDQDCNGVPDNGVTTTFYQDKDGDGYGNAAMTTQACSMPVGYVLDKTDCNDGNMSVHPGATEICFNGLDDNCDGSQDEAPECNITCDWSGEARWLSHGWDGGNAFSTGAYFSCISGKLSDVTWIVGAAGTNVTPSPSGTSDPIVGCTWGVGQRWGSQGYDSAGAFTYGAYAVCDGTRVTGMTWKANSYTTTTPKAGQLGCNWTGAIWISNGIDGSCAFQTGFAITCNNNHITHFQFIDGIGCPRGG